MCFVRIVASAPLPARNFFVLGILIGFTERVDSAEESRLHGKSRPCRRESASQKVDRLHGKCELRKKIKENRNFNSKTHV